MPSSSSKSAPRKARESSARTPRSAKTETNHHSLNIVADSASFRVLKSAELVANTLRNKIVRGELPDGHVLPSEAELNLEYPISRPTLREALRILESEGLITVTRGVRGGARVHRPDPRLAALHVGRVLQNRKATLTDIFAARMVIEPSCARLLAQQGKAGVLKTLHSLLDEERATENDLERFSAASVRFHNSLVELTGNAALILVMAILNHIYELQVPTLSVMQVLGTAGDITRRQTIDTHARLLALIETRDGDGAAGLLLDFLTRIDRQLRKLNDADRVLDVLE